ncbi:GTPase IMAP family member 9 [Danio aesculapii]|uniref:GTPase IMAP family member 9 n=1 Tax=Danio aesculapii TaxID=1142201 RepID=UPI0024C08200|nr:GTPase IMAP family member 9 [Danio aesculapii]
MQQTCDSLHLQLIGKTGSGVSASANTILGEKTFKSERSLTSITDRCQKHTAEVCNRTVTVVDSVNFFNSNDIDLRVELQRELRTRPEGIHAILLVLRLHTFTEQDAELLSLHKQMFGESAIKHTIVLFTHGDELQDKSLDQLIRENSHLSKVIEECEGRFHLLNNKDLNNKDQVTKLLMKIERMLCENENRCYTLQMFMQARAIRIHHLCAVSVVIVFALGYVNMRNEGSWGFNSFLCGCFGGLLSALAGYVSGRICANMWKKEIKCTKRHLKNVKLLAIACGCGTGGIHLFLTGPVCLSTALLRGTQGSLMAYITMMKHSRMI